MKRFEYPWSPMPTPGQKPGDYRRMLRERREFDLNGKVGYMQGYFEAMVFRVERLEQINSDLQERVARLEARMKR
jgi:hypothetical protein